MLCQMCQMCQFGQKLILIVPPTGLEVWRTGLEVPLPGFAGGRTAGRVPPTGLEAWRTGL